MLTYLHRLANTFHWLSWPARLLSGLALCAIGYLLIIAQDATQQANWLTPLLLTFIWALTLSVFLHIFQGGDEETPPKGWWKKLKHRITRILRKIIGFIFIVVSVAVIYFTLRVLRT